MSNIKATGSKIQFDPKTRRPIIGSPKAAPKTDVRATNTKLRGGPRNQIRRAGPRGG